MILKIFAVVAIVILAVFSPPGSTIKMARQHFEIGPANLKALAGNQSEPAGFIFPASPEP